jgi:hypothetical protein
MGLLALVLLACVGTAAANYESFGWTRTPDADEGVCTVERVAATSLTEDAFRYLYLEQVSDAHCRAHCRGGQAGATNKI